MSTDFPALPTFHGSLPMIDPEDVAILLVDHQSGLFQVVRDLSVPDLRRNATVLAKVAGRTGMPVVATASVPQGPNGPLIPEIQEHAPQTVYVPRKGEVNAWDCVDFVEAVKSAGTKQFIIAGTLTTVCMAFPTLSAVAEGYQLPAESHQKAQEVERTGEPSDSERD
ncbi:MULTISPECIES: isochorismatase family protein [Kocuria]|uniref:isochorismatase family protein n=1 Tax=Kocuria TaxID=57493 RepID=UPI0010401E84|nr:MULTISPECIES: isochorismatase family protein [Kocuria]MDT0119845.1 isochorismatase family protein [Kocuria sp. PD6]QBJ21390.1 isochorismatase family protein [Kocuria indica]